jgi:hypothetical protein
MASAATAEMWTGWRDALRSRFDDCRGVGTGEAGLFFGDCGCDFLSAENKGDEYGLAFSARIGGKAGESVAAVDELFYGEEQELILRYSQPRAAELWPA